MAQCELFFNCAVQKITLLSCLLAYT